MFKLLIVTIIIRWTLLLAYKYEMLFQNPEILSPCDDFPDNFVDKFAISPENFTLLPDGNIYVGGDLVITYDFQPNVNYPVVAEFYKRKRGVWQPTVYTIRRADVCTATFSPLEIWHKVVKTIPNEQRTCPLRKNQKFSLNFVTDTVFELDLPNEAGDYLARIEVGTNAPPDDIFFCANVYYSLYRI